jgi:hypothetical protein
LNNTLTKRRELVIRISSGKAFEAGWIAIVKTSMHEYAYNLRIKWCEGGIIGKIMSER